MELPDEIFKPGRYTYQDYLQWEGDWELVNGSPYAMAPSPTREHQWISGKFIRIVSNEIDKSASINNCEAFYGLDWIINESTVIRPDCSVICVNSDEDYITSPPVMVLETSSQLSKLRDRNTKYNLYEIQGVKYYLIADTEKKSVEAFELLNDRYAPKYDTNFQLTPACKIDFNVFSLWQSM